MTLCLSYLVGKLESDYYFLATDKQLVINFISFLLSYIAKHLRRYKGLNNYLRISKQKYYNTQVDTCFDGKDFHILLLSQYLPIYCAEAIFKSYDVRCLYSTPTNKKYLLETENIGRSDILSEKMYNHSCLGKRGTRPLEVLLSCLKSRGSQIGVVLTNFLLHCPTLAVTSGTFLATLKDQDL